MRTGLCGLPEYELGARRRAHPGRLIGIQFAIANREIAMLSKNDDKGLGDDARSRRVQGLKLLGNSPFQLFGRLDLASIQFHFREVIQG